jgi:hypothetical protein
MSALAQNFIRSADSLLAHAAEWAEHRPRRILRRISHAQERFQNRAQCLRDLTETALKKPGPALPDAPYVK